MEQRTLPSSSMTAGVHSGPCKPNGFAQMPRRVVPDAQERNPLFGSQTLEQGRRGRGRGCSCYERGSEMAATSGAFVGGEMAGALFVLGKTAMGAHINRAWATPRRLPGSGSVTPLMERTFCPEAVKCSSR